MFVPFMVVQGTSGGTCRKAGHQKRDLLRPFRIPGAIGHLGDYRRLAADRRALILLQNLWKPVNKVLTCTENAEEPNFTRR